MNGIYNIFIKNRRLEYNFNLNSKVTIIRGNSASGKTTLHNIISDYLLDSESSNIDISITPQCNIIAYDSVFWDRGDRPDNSIVFIDEHFRYLNDHEFNRFLNTSNNYFVITDRDDTGNIDYGIKDIYELHTSQKYATIFRRYSNYFDIIKDIDNPGTLLSINKINTIITEDSKLGCDFYKHLYGKNTVSAYNNVQIEDKIKENIDDNLFVVVDGSAFGKFIQSVDILVNENENIHLFAPESFEYLLLKSNILKRVNLDEAMYYNDVHIDDILEAPENYIDITRYTREQYYTEILNKCMAKTRHPYSKSTKDTFYFSPKLLSDARKIIPIKVDNFLENTVKLSKDGIKKMSLV